MMKMPFKTEKAEVAQLVEHQPSKLRVAGSNLVFRSKSQCSSGVERFLGKEEVMSSNLITGSINIHIYLKLQLWQKKLLKGTNRTLTSVR